VIVRLAVPRRVAGRMHRAHELREREHEGEQQVDGDGSGRADHGHVTGWMMKPGCIKAPSLAASRRAEKRESTGLRQPTLTSPASTVTANVRNRFPLHGPSSQNPSS
jgi:hypothetical protein